MRIQHVGEEVFCLFTSLFFLKQMECSHPTRVLEITLSRANSNCYSRVRFQRISAWFIWAFGHRKEKLRTKLLWTNTMVKVKLLSHVRLCDPMDCNISASSLRGFPGKSSRVGCHFLLQGIFPTQGSNPSLPHCRQVLYRLSHQGSPSQLLKWVAYPFSRGPSQPRIRTRISCIAGRFFTSWATREVLMFIEVCVKVCSKMSNSLLSHNPSNSYPSPQNVAPPYNF